MPTRSVPVGEIRRLGDRALLIGVPDAAGAHTLTRLIRTAALPGVVEVVGGLATVMVTFDSGPAELDSRRPEFTTLMERALGQPDGELTGVLLEIPCTFDGPDLAEVATHCGATPAAVVALLTARPLTVDAVGFSPGFAYLGGLPEALRRVPRRSRPRPSVPAGSVALANGHAAVYPSATPGGWQLIGRTGEPLFTPWEPPYARLSPGDRVQFVLAPDRAGTAAAVEPQGAGSTRLRTTWRDGARRVFVVEEPGLRSALQDGGRQGLAALGVPAAGPADPLSFRLANQLVGNRPDACALEVTARGPTLRCRSSTYVAIVGARPDLRLDGRPVAAERVVPLNAGQRLVIGPVRDGLRSYVALAGGFVGPPVLESLSSDQLAGLGPGPLQRDDELWGAAMVPPLGDHLRDGTPSSTLGPGTEPVVVRVVPGPHPERFGAGAFAALASARFHVDAVSNRVGLRLRRDRATPPVMTAVGESVELDSQGMVTGAVQVPPDGEPVILLGDHATLGGYPVVAVVAEVDHGVLGQCTPGSLVVLVPIEPATATAALRAQQHALQTAVVGHYPLAVE
jgi:KipI family sensor histidine kinase inhibitor